MPIVVEDRGYTDQEIIQAIRSGYGRGYAIPYRAHSYSVSVDKLDPHLLYVDLGHSYYLTLENLKASISGLPRVDDTHQTRPASYRNMPKSKESK